MKANIFRVLYIIPFLIWGCSVDSNISNTYVANPNKPQGIYGETQFENLDSIQNEIKPDTQTFNISDTSTNSTITGAEGTTVTINANSILTMGGTPYAGVVTANLSEFLTPNAMILSSVQTSSNVQLLVSGGSFEFSLQADKLRR